MARSTIPCQAACFKRVALSLHSALIDARPTHDLILLWFAKGMRDGQHRDLRSRFGKNL